jgi:hypothetical protein
MSTYLRIVCPVLFLSLAVALPCGCRTRPQAADPAKARETLLRTLDAWQKGETPQSLNSLGSSLTVSEPRWAKGYRLLRYEVADQDSASGYDQQLAATLVLQDAAGKQFREKALYNVSTHPALVVVRVEG